MTMIRSFCVLNVQHDDRGRPGDGLPSPSLAVPL